MVRVAAPVVAAMALAGACASSAFDRDAAVDRAVAGGLTPDQAECYVDRVAEEVGTDVLDGDPPAPEGEDGRALAAIRIDCVGVEALGRPRVPAPPAAPPAEGTAGTGPRTFGDDPGLDELWVACEQGDGGACDRLFDDAPLGSDYESFGATCGNRGAEPTCAAVYTG
jgi:hypothetical protein